MYIVYTSELHLYFYSNSEKGHRITPLSLSLQIPGFATSGGAGVNGKKTVRLTEDAFLLLNGFSCIVRHCHYAEIANELILDGKTVDVE